MKVVVSTCNKYRHLMGGFAFLFNLYWGADQAVEVWGFDPPALALPDNFAWRRLDDVERRAWSDYMRSAAEAMPEDRFLFLFDDYWLFKSPARAEIEYAATLVQDGVDKFDLSYKTAFRQNVPWRDEYVRAVQPSKAHAMLQPAIWRTEYWIEQCRSGLNPWEWEIEAEKVWDGVVCIGAPGGYMSVTCQFANVYHRGQPDANMLRRCWSSDLTEIGRMGHWNGNPPAQSSRPKNQ
jgi:hypothetical protein